MPRQPGTGAHWGPQGDGAGPSALIRHALLLPASPTAPSSPDTTGYTDDEGQEMGTAGRQCDTGLG